MTQRWLLAPALTLSVVASVAAGATPAQAGSATLARQLTDMGIDAQQREDHVAALAYFDRALKELVHPKIRYFRAKSLRAVGRLDEALAEFRAIQDDADVEKYHSEIVAFIVAIEGEQERRLLEQQLERERREREKLETDKKRLEDEARRAAAERAAADERARRAAEEAQRAADELAARRGSPGGPLGPEPSRGPLAPSPARGPLPDEPAHGPLTPDPPEAHPAGGAVRSPRPLAPRAPDTRVEPDSAAWGDEEVEPAGGSQARADGAPRPEAAYEQRLRRYDRRHIAARTFVTAGVLSVALGILLVANPFGSDKLDQSDVAPKAGKGLIGAGAVVLVGGLMMWPRRPAPPGGTAVTDGSPSPRVGLTPVLGPRSGGLLLHASF
ncbi:MAG: hypothetical protein H6746_08885 [Deltaproteobacteria bacterium]|nr:hypothetical protein [Deltaproteobacteria bacterium]